MCLNQGLPREMFRGRSYLRTWGLFFFCFFVFVWGNQQYIRIIRSDTVVD